MARVGLSWAAGELADRAGVGVNTISRFENNAVEPSPETIQRLRAAFEAAGIEFIDETATSGAGLRFKEATMHMIKRPTWNPDGLGYVSFLVTKGGRDFAVLVGREILRDFRNRPRGRTWNAPDFVASFKLNEAAILASTKNAIGDSDRAGPDMRIALKKSDFATDLFS